MPDKWVSIEHVLPQIGATKIPLYSPADTLYRCLRNHGEIRRLNKLRHLGALSHALPGTRFARWDYTVAMLYYAQHLELTGMKSAFKLGNAEFTSSQAALQTIALCWNVGHVPGIFPVEKGIYRFLYETDSATPANILEWPSVQDQRIQQIQCPVSTAMRQNGVKLSNSLAGVQSLQG